VTRDGETAPDRRPDSDVRLLALDLDGTILEPGPAIAEPVLGALRELRDRGVACVIASGRPIEFQLDLLTDHHIGPETGCFRALIGDERELFLLHQNPEPAYVPHREWNEGVQIRWRVLAPESMLWLERATAEAARQEWAVSEIASEDAIRRRGLATLTCDSVPDAAALCRWLSAALSEAGSALACNRNVRQVQVHDREAGKGAVLAMLTGLWSLLPGQVLAIGDTLNDAAMLDGRRGFRAATVANADGEIKAMVRHGGGYIAGERRGAGVLEALSALGVLR
jgi:hydroxymethylpyrimidine pyrophosphatase-like HAD family hydrolase